VEAEPGQSSLTVDDAKHEKRVRKFALAGLILVVVVLISILLVGGAGSLPVTVFLLVMGGMGIYQSTQLLRHPELIRRTPPGPTVDEIIAHGGIVLGADAQGLAPGETRLAIQDALDSIRQVRSSSRFGIPVAPIVGVGTLAWIAGAVASLVLGPDFAAAALCLVGAVGFGALTVVSARLEKRFRKAEGILEGQLISLNVRTGESPGTSGLSSGRE